MLEVEMKFKVENREQLLAHLKRLGFRELETHMEIDTYYNAPDKDFALTDEALRLRQVGSQCRLTYKGPKRGELGKVRKEHEVDLNDGSARMMHQILLDLRYMPSIEVRKQRKVFQHAAQKDIEVAWDEVEQLGTYVELELKVPESDQAEALVCLQSLARSMDLIEEERRSYLELLMQRST